MPKKIHFNFCPSLQLAFRFGQPGAKKRTTIIFQTVDFVWCPDDVLVATQKTRGQSLASIKARRVPPKKPLGIRRFGNRWLVRIVWVFFGEIFCLKQKWWFVEKRSQIFLWIKSIEQFRLISNDVFLPLEWLVTHEWKKNSGSLGNLVN